MRVARPTETIVRAVLLVSFVAVVFGRMPRIVLQGGRFWAEEGAVYFLNAWNQPWYEAWFAIHTGYINFAAAVAAWAGLEFGGVAHAPAVTVVISAMLQCLPVYAILTHDLPWRRSMLGTTAAVLVCAMPPVTGEVWPNTITSQFHLALFAALILAAPPARRGSLVLDCGLLALAALSGPATSFLAPLFGLKALRERDGKVVAFGAIVVGGFCLQAGIYLQHVMPERGDRLGVAALLSVISLHTIVLQFAGFGTARRFAAHVGAVHAAHRLLLAGPGIFVGFYGVVAAAIWRMRDAVLGWLLAAGLMIAVVSFMRRWTAALTDFCRSTAGNVMRSYRWSLTRCW